MQRAPSTQTGVSRSPHVLGRQLSVGGQRSGAQSSGLGKDTQPPCHSIGTRQGERQSVAVSVSSKIITVDLAEGTPKPAPSALTRAAARTRPGPRAKPPTPGPARERTGNRGAKGCEAQPGPAAPGHQTRPLASVSHHGPWSTVWEPLTASQRPPSLGVAPRALPSLSITHCGLHPHLPEERTA